MSRLHLRDDQIQCLDRPTLSSLHDEINEELCILADVERSIYKRRRALDIEDDPTLLEDKHYPVRRQVKSRFTTEELIESLKSLNLTKEELKQFIK